MQIIIETSVIKIIEKNCFGKEKESNLVKKLS